MLLGRLWHTQRMLQVAHACGLFVAWGRVEYSVLGGQPTHGLANSTGGLLMPHHTGCVPLWAASGVLCVSRWLAQRVLGFLFARSPHRAGTTFNQRGLHPSAGAVFAFLRPVCGSVCFLAVDLNVACLCCTDASFQQQRMGVQVCACILTPCVCIVWAVLYCVWGWLPVRTSACWPAVWGLLLLFVMVWVAGGCASFHARAAHHTQRTQLSPVCVCLCLWRRTAAAWRLYRPLAALV